MSTENAEEKDFGFYGDEADEIENTNIEGVTGNVTSFTYTKMDYPCIIFNEDFKCPKHQLSVVKKMVESNSGEKDISLYFIQKNELFKIGMISGMQVSAFLDIIGIENVKGHMSSEIPLENGMLYALCTAS